MTHSGTDESAIIAPTLRHVGIPFGPRLLSNARFDTQMTVDITLRQGHAIFSNNPDATYGLYQTTPNFLCPLKD